MLAFQGGDDQAFDKIVTCYRPHIFHFLRRTLRDAERAEDLTQEVFVRVYRSRSRYKPSAAFRTWLFTIASRLALNEARSLRRRRRVFADVSSLRASAGEPGSHEEFWASCPDTKSEAPAQSVQRKELEALLETLLDGLPGNQRAALELQQGQQLSYSEIAAALDLTTMAVKSLLLRARENLKVGLQAYLQEPIALEKESPPA
jgi:RNA polymerase sigma-70 factor (ECF subfamily)